MSQYQSQDQENLFDCCLVGGISVSCHGKAVRIGGFFDRNPNVHTFTRITLQSVKYRVTRVSKSTLVKTLKFSTIKTRIGIGHPIYLGLPGERICEWTPTPWEGDRKMTQIEQRFATGERIERLWKTHRALAPSYHYWRERGSRMDYINYFPFKNDCHTYVNRILEASGEKPSGLMRVEKGFWRTMGKFCSKVLP